MTPTRPSAPPSRGGRDEPRSRAPAPVRRGQRRAGLGADRRLLGPGGPGLAGLGSRAASGAGQRPRPRNAVRCPLDSRSWREAVRRKHGPEFPTALVAAAGAVLAAALAAAAVTRVARIARRVTQPGDPVAALSKDQSIRELSQAPAAEQGIRLRPSLTGTRPGALAPADIGLALGRLQQPGGNGPDLYASWEDTLIAFMGPR